MIANRGEVILKSESFLSRQFLILLVLHIFIQLSMYPTISCLRINIDLESQLTRTTLIRSK